MSQPIGRKLKTIRNPPDAARNPPDAAALMMSARSFGNYDLAGALADRIDNSIKAKARNIWIAASTTKATRSYLSETMAMA